MQTLKAIDESQLDSIKNDNVITVLFKHSTRCSISSMALSRIKNYTASTSVNHASYLVDVIAQRSLSNKIAQDFEIRHESPQLIVLKNGKVAHHSSHGSINQSTLLSVLDNLNQTG